MTAAPHQVAVAVLATRIAGRFRRRLRGAGVRLRARPADAATVAPARRPAAGMKRDVIDRLFRQGRLSRLHLSAAEEILQVWQALSRSLLPARRLELARVDGGPGPRDPLARLGPRAERLLRRRFAPWAASLRRRPVRIPRRGGSVAVPTALALVLDVVVRNAGLTGLEPRHGLQRGKGEPALVLRAGLERYAEVAGWTGGRRGAGLGPARERAGSSPSAPSPRPAPPEGGEGARGRGGEVPARCADRWGAATGRAPSTRRDEGPG